MAPRRETTRDEVTPDNTVTTARFRQASVLQAEKHSDAMGEMAANAEREVAVKWCAQRR